MTLRIRIYSDKGAGPRSVRLLHKALEIEGVQSTYPLQTINAEEIRSDHWKQETALLIFPGGRDLYYHSALQGKGNRSIKEYVQSGGQYLGICAGGYYGCRSVLFEKGGPLEVEGERELAFFPGLAEGPVYGLGKFDYLSERGASIATIAWENGEKNQAYFNGGCAFIDPEKYEQVKVLGRYADLSGSPAAILECTIGEGKAVLCGAHPEYSVEHLNIPDPAVQELLPSLKKIENSRRALFQNILGMFQLNIKTAANT